MEFFPQSATPIVAVTQMSSAAEGLDHPEGLAFDRDGNLWAGGEAGQIYLINGRQAQTASAPDGEQLRVATVGNVGGFCLGITVSQQQELFVCNAGLHCLQKVGRDGKILATWDNIADRPLVTPNFSVFDAHGNLFFSDSGIWNQHDGVVYRLRPDGVCELFAGPFSFANGLALSAGGDFLFVAESQRDQVTRVEILPDGRAGAREVYAAGLARIPDGLALDAAGNLYVTCYATDCIYRVTPQRVVELYAFDPEGTMLARPTNIAFGGPDHTSMFVANLGRWHITKLPCAVAGQLLTGQEPRA